jgi:hypothetical protein
MLAIDASIFFAARKKIVVLIPGSSPGTTMMRIET